MSLIEVLTGQKPLFRSTRRKQFEQQIETEFSALINSKSANNYRYIPPPSGAVMEATALAEETKPSTVSGRFTLNPTSRVKILDTGQDEWDIYITVPNPGQVAYASHSGTRIVSTNNQIHEGIPLTNNPTTQGRPAPNHLRWRGELWLQGDTANMVVDIEAS